MFGTRKPVAAGARNDIHGDASTAAYLLQFDSVHGRFVGYECKSVDNGDKSQSFEVKGNGVVEQVGFSSHPKPDQVPWKDLGVSLVLECTGAFKTKEKLNPYFSAGVKRSSSQPQSKRMVYLTLLLA